MSQYPGDTAEAVELRQKFFAKHADRDEYQAALHELETHLVVQFGLLEGRN